VLGLAGHACGSDQRMKKEGTIGAAAVVAIAAMLGFGLQNGSKQEGMSASSRGGIVTKTTLSKTAHEETLACASLHGVLEDFLDINNLEFPAECYEPGHAPAKQTQKTPTERVSQLKFVIALLPDPVHTHLPVLFDQFAAAVQEGAQDEKYDFDESWLPWEDEDSHYALLADEKTANHEKEMKEDQPGVILFRRALDCSSEPGQHGGDCRSAGSSEGLVVFIVGEDATHGIHREQFRNAMRWTAAIEPKTKNRPTAVAILGPTFSGSLPSLALVFSDPEIAGKLDLPNTQNNHHLAIYSGSVSDDSSAENFRNRFKSRVIFHSFVRSDTEILKGFCNFIGNEQPGFDPRKVALISEDETAYGRSATDGQECPDAGLKLYYPRDISTLRSAYQTKSLFDGTVNQQPAETQRTNLPTDLADPAGKVHDSIRTYGGNQTPLTQEAFLLGIATALREFHSRFIILRSSNTLDQLFLTNFLRRAYPDGRILILGSDLMFVRERGSTGLSGAMTLSTYPLFPLARDWTEYGALPASDRVFGTDTAEGTYIALRLLLNEASLNNDRADSKGCHVLVNEKGVDDSAAFVPPISCTSDPTIPDYGPPNWMPTERSMEYASTVNCFFYPGPLIWLSVIGANSFWPMASLTTESNKISISPNSKANCGEPGKASTQKVMGLPELGQKPEVPIGMKVFWLVLALFSVFHAWCCWSGSYTAKPSFRAYFASRGDWRHALLVFGGSCCVAFLAIVAGWGSGVFTPSKQRVISLSFSAVCAIFVCVIAWVAILANGLRTLKLSRDVWLRPAGKITIRDSTILISRAFVLLVPAMVMFWLCFVIPIEGVLDDKNRVLTYWRAMHLTNGVSPLVPIFSILAGLYLSIWFSLHGLALFGPDRPCLPPKPLLPIKSDDGTERDLLKMFSQEEADEKIERAARPLNWKTGTVALGLFVLFAFCAFGMAGGTPVRSLGAKSYAIIFFFLLDVCGSLVIAEAWGMYVIWEELRRLLTFLDRLPLRRTFEVLHGFSWGGVWKMSGNVLEVRYKVISRQIESMNHTIASLQSLNGENSDPGIRSSLAALLLMRDSGMEFAKWYSDSYTNPVAGDLSSFEAFQQSTAVAAKALLTQLLVPAWRLERESLLLETSRTKQDGKEAPDLPKDDHIRNAEEFVCLAYLAFVQNILGRLRTVAMIILVLFLATTAAVSAYPFDPRQGLSAVLVTLFVIAGVVIVKVYAEMHRDATLSHVTNTNPGELGTEFWFKIIGFGFAPLIGLLTRIFPSITEFVFSWLQPGVASLK
jgi:hypothetical protein